MGSKIYPKVHENPRAFFSSSSPIFLEPLAHGSSDWSLPREDCIRVARRCWTVLVLHAASIGVAMFRYRMEMVWWLWIGWWRGEGSCANLVGVGSDLGWSWCGVARD